MLGSSSQPCKRLGGEDDRISRKLSYVLRHGAALLKLSVNEAGFVPVSSLRSYVKGLEFLTDERATEIADRDRKNRFGLWSDEDNNLHIRANQGHSEKVSALIDTHQLLQPLSISDIPDLCVHGTALEAWTEIRVKGLSKMNRNMIHFATGLPHDRSVVSGMRVTSEVLIFIRVAAAIEDGIPFYRSENNVLLSPGISGTGLLPVKYFEKVVRRETGQILEPNQDVQ